MYLLFQTFTFAQAVETTKSTIGTTQENKENTPANLNNSPPQASDSKDKNSESAPPKDTLTDNNATPATPPAPMGFIRDIRFVGLVRTSRKWLMSMFGAFIGCPVQYFQEAQLRGGLEAIGVFRDVKIDLIKATAAPDSDAIIVVTVKEAWSIFGAVYGWGDDAGFVGGFAFTDMNVFGRKNIFMLTGAFGADIQQGNMMFMKPPMGVKKPGFIINTEISNNTPYYSTFDDDEIVKKEMLKTGVGVSIFGFCPIFMYTAGFHYLYNGWFHDDIINLHVVSLDLTLSKGWDKKNEWFPITRNLGIGGKFDIDCARWGKPMGELTLSGIMTWDIKNYPRMLFRLSAKGGLTFERPITMQFNRDTVKSFIAINT